MIDVSPDLLSFLKEEYDRCIDLTLEQERETAIDRYDGEPYGDEEEGRSQVVARDTAESTDYMMISILRTFFSGDRVVEFVHRNADAAHQATETIMHLFMDEQDGWQIAHDWLKAGLLEKNAVCMTYAEPQPKKRVEGEISAMAMQAAEQQGHKFIEAEQIGEHPDEGPIFKAASLVEQPPKFCDAAVPNEEFYCSPDARTITEAALKGRRVRKTLSDLVEMGFDRDEVEDISSDTMRPDMIAQARDEDRVVNMGARRGMARVIWWHEEFVRFDADEDGVAELLYVRRSSDYKVFSVDKMDSPDDHPFEDWCPFPMQHRRIGQSLADKVMDIERIRTVLLRQSLDGIYLGNNPTIDIHEDSIGENTIEDLLSLRPGKIRRYKGNMGPPIASQMHFDPGAGFQMLEFMNGERESRTGITRLNQGLDADTLNKTATGTALMQAQGQQVEEYLARNFANAMAKLFTKKARLLKRYGKPITVPIDGEYIEVDPAQWPEDMIARPRVGLGSGRKEQRVAFLREVIGMQASALQAGLDIVDAKKFYNSGKAFVADTNLGDVSQFFNDPDKPQIDPQTGQPVQKQAKPDPEMAKVQAGIQAKQAELAMQREASAAKLGLQQQEMNLKLSLMQQQGAQKQQMDAQQALMENQLQQAKASAEASLAERQQQLDAMLAMQKIAADERSKVRAAAFSAHVQKMRDGGRLDA